MAGQSSKLKIAYAIELLFIALFSFIPLLSLAAEPTEYTLLQPIPGITQYTDATGQNVRTTFPVYLTGIFKVAIGIAAALAVLMIAIAGLQYMTSDVISSKSAARERMTNAIIGLLLALASVLILNTVSPTIIQSNMSLSNIQPPNMPPSSGQSSPYNPALETYLKQATDTYTATNNTLQGFYTTQEQKKADLVMAQSDGDTAKVSDLTHQLDLLQAQITEYQYRVKVTRDVMFMYQVKCVSATNINTNDSVFNGIISEIQALPTGDAPLISTATQSDLVASTQSYKTTTYDNLKANLTSGCTTP